MESHARFSNALQAHRVPELQQGGYEVVPGTGLRTGDTAMVACVSDGANARYAVRVAAEFGTGLFWERHYHSMSEGLPWSVRQYFPQHIHPVPSGITLVGRKMPAVLMEWIPGPTLYDAVARAAQRGNVAVLDALAASLRDLSIGLRDGRVTHGDLTPDNLILRETGDLVCVDLDTLEWPGARKRVHDVKDHPFRHPRRSGTPAHQDAYAILVMFVSTMLLREQPSLADGPMSSERPLNAGWLFSPWDLADPAESDTIANVRERVGEQGRTLLGLLIEAAGAEAFRAQSLLDQAFDTVQFLEVEDSPDPQRVEDVPTPALDAARELDIAAAVASLRELYGDHRAEPPKHRGDYQGTWPEPAGRSVEPPPAPPLWDEDRPPVEPPTEVVRRPIERLTRRPSRDVSKVLEDEARAARAIDQRIAVLARDRDDEAILELAAQAANENLILEERTRHTVRSARERLTIRARLQRALAENDRRELADLAVSGELALLGDTTRESLVQVLQALEWPSLLRALETDDDALILMWHDEEVFADQRLIPTALRRRIELARERTAWIESVRIGLQNRDAEGLEPLIANEPEGGRMRLSDGERRRVRELIDRRRALQELDRSLRSGNTQRVISALGIVERTGAEIDDSEMWSAVRQIVDRANLLRSTIEAARQSPPDDRALASLVPQIREHGLSHDPALRGEFSIDKLQSYIVRGAAVRRIRRGIEQDDDRAIRLAAFPDTTGAHALLTSEERERVQIARANKRVKRIDL